MSETLEIDLSEFEAQLSQFVLYSGRSMEDEIKNQAKLAVHKAIRVTPPGHDGVKDSEAKQAGERKIRRNLRSVFSGVEIKGARLITHLFGKQVKGAPWFAMTRERHPDVAALHDSRKKKSGKFGLTRSGRQKFYVDERKLAQLEAVLLARVGFLAAGYSSAAQVLGTKMPVYVKRHAGRAPGSVQMKFTDELMRITVRNSVKYASRVPDVQRRLQWAINEQAKAMERQLPHLIRRHEKLVN